MKAARVWLVFLAMLSLWMVACNAAPAPATESEVEAPAATIETMEPTVTMEMEPTPGMDPTATAEMLEATATTEEMVEPTAEAETSTETGQPLRLAIGDDESTLTPYSYVFGYPGYYLMKFVYDSLLELDTDNIAQPWLAETMEVSDDGLTYSFTLREGVLWHDGEPFTADDVVFTYEYFVEHPEQSRFLRSASAVESIEATDDQTVVMTLTQADPTFDLRLADVPILPEHIWAEVDDPANFAGTVGTGPYLLAAYEPQQFYRLTANPDYFMGAPAVAEIVLPIINDQSTLFSALQSGEIDGAWPAVPAELVAQFEQFPDIALQSGPGFSSSLLQFNDERSPFDQTAVRQAMAHAINREEMVETLLLGSGTLGNPGFIHPASPYANTELALAYDPDMANALLEEAGFTDSDGDGTREADGEPMQYTLLVYSDDPLLVRAAELIQGYVAEIGVTLDVEALDPETVDSLVWPDFDVASGRDFDLAMWGWSASVQTNPSRFVELVHSDPVIGSLNIGGYQNEEFDAMAETFAGALDLDERTEMLNEMQAFVADELPFVTLYYAEGIYAYRPDAYDGYVYVSGLGIMNKLSFLGMDQ